MSTGNEVESFAISGDGRVIGFVTDREGIDGQNSNPLIGFLRDTVSGAVEAADRLDGQAVARGTDGRFSRNYVSGDGTRYAFTSSRPAPVNGVGFPMVFLRDRLTNRTIFVSRSLAGGLPNNNSVALDGLSEDGRVVLFRSAASDHVTGDTGNDQDLFTATVLVATNTVTIERVSVTDGEQELAGGSVFGTSASHGILNRDGRFVAFTSDATTVGGLYPGTATTWNVYVRDRVAGTTELASVSTAGSPANGQSWTDGSQAALFGAGRYLSFISVASNLVANDTNNGRDCFVRDLVAKTTMRGSLNHAGQQLLQGAFQVCQVTGDGQYVLFDGSPNVAPGPNDTTSHLFVRNLATGAIQRVSVNQSAALADDYSAPAYLASQGRHVLFWSQGRNLVPNDTNGQPDLFLVRLF